MARLEPAATLRKVRYMNQYLITVVLDRTLKSIKGVLRKDAYRALVAAAVIDLKTTPPAEPESLDHVPALSGAPL